MTKEENGSWAFLADATELAIPWASWFKLGIWASWPVRVIMSPRRIISSVASRLMSPMVLYTVAISSAASPVSPRLAVATARAACAPAIAWISFKPAEAMELVAAINSAALCVCCFCHSRAFFIVASSEASMLPMVLVVLLRRIAIASSASKAGAMMPDSAFCIF